jgi:hypothetical protein
MHKLWKEAAGKLGIEILSTEEKEDLMMSAREASVWHKAHDLAQDARYGAERQLQEEQFAGKGLQEQVKLLTSENTELKLLVGQQAKRIERMKKAKK